MNRRELLSGLALGASALATGSLSAPTAPFPGARTFAVTIDDFQIQDGPLMDGTARHRAILDALEAAGVQAAGFVAGKYVDDATGRARLQAWADAGHALGNHTYDHAYYGGSDPGDLGADIDRNAPLIEACATHRRWFRFPYLNEGRSVESRDRMRAVLSERGLSNAHVTIDASDWYVAQRLTDRLARDPGADLAPYRDYLVAHLLDRAAFYDGLARDLLGYSPHHTLLMHHNLTTALFLPDVLEAFAAKGWRAIDADDAFGHPIFQARPEIAPAANSLIWQMARADGRFGDRLRSPGEDGPYEKAAMDALGL
jgi:peptidoglycan/xylan/chitin deacetylase (PgdA/CDA1 family)